MNVLFLEYLMGQSLFWCKRTVCQFLATLTIDQANIYLIVTEKFLLTPFHKHE